MIRSLLLLTLAATLSSCLVVTERRGQVSPSDTTVVVPAAGNYTYTCNGGTLVVNYLSNTQARVFYDGAFQLLTRSGNTGTFTNNIYTWELRGSSGSLSVRGQTVLSSCRI